MASVVAEPFRMNSWGHVWKAMYVKPACTLGTQKLRQRLLMETPTDEDIFQSALVK